MKIYAATLAVLIMFSTASFAQAPALPSIDADSEATFSQLAPELKAKLATAQAAVKDYQITLAEWRTAEGKALATASLDPGMYQVDPTGKTFMKRQGPRVGR